MPSASRRGLFLGIVEKSATSSSSSGLLHRLSVGMSYPPTAAGIVIVNVVAVAAVAVVGLVVAIAVLLSDQLLRQFGRGRDCCRRSATKITRVTVVKV